MAITTGDSIFKYGTQDLLTAGGGTSAVATGVKSAAADGVDWTNDDDAAFGSFILNVTFSVTPTTRTGIQLYARLLNVEGTNDLDLIDGAHDGIYVGTFIVNDGTAAQWLGLIDAPIPSVKSSQEMRFYVLNSTSQSMTAGWKIWTTPKGWGAQA